MSKYRNIYPKIDILENDVDIKFSIFPSSIILNNKFYVSYVSLEASKIYKMYYRENNIILKYEYDGNDYTITIQFENTKDYEDTKDYVNCALSIITCIKSVREQVYITGECDVY